MHMCISLAVVILVHSSEITLLSAKVGKLLFFVFLLCATPTHAIFGIAT